MEKPNLEMGTLLLDRGGKLRTHVSSLETVATRQTRRQPSQFSASNVMMVVASPRANLGSACVQGASMEFITYDISNILSNCSPCLRGEPLTGAYMEVPTARKTQAPAPARNGLGV